MPELSALVVAALAGSVLGASWLVFRRVRLERPPLGAIDHSDIVFMAIVIMVMPWLYLALPPVAAAAVLLLGLTAVTAMLLGSVLGARIGRIVALALALSVVAASLSMPSSLVAISINDLVLAVAIVAVANLWAQGGMRAGHLALLAGFLTVYDITATSILQLTGDLFAQQSGQPFAPVLAWPVGSGADWLGIGIGDVLMASTSVLVLYKAFGREAGLVAAAAAMATITGLLLFRDVVDGVLPVMAVLGPVIIGQVAWWRKRGPERSTLRFLEEEPPRWVGART